MNTFGLNRPVYSFGLGLILSLIPGGPGQPPVPGDQIFYPTDDRYYIATDCPREFIPTDAREFIATEVARILEANEEPRILIATDGRIAVVTEQDIFVATDNRIYLATEVQTFQVTDDRVFVATDNRKYTV